MKDAQEFYTYKLYVKGRIKELFYISKFKLIKYILNVIYANIYSPFEIEGRRRKKY